MATVIEIILEGKDQLSNAVNSAQSSLGGLGGVAQSALGFLTSNVILGGLSSLADSFGALKDGMIGGNAEFERYETQFGVLLGSTEAAKERLQELARVGASTPFELPELVRGDKILQGFGLHSEEAAKRFGFSGEEIRLIAGDMAAGTGQSFESMATYLGKFASGATGEVLSRFQELGIVTKEQLAQLGLEFSKSGELVTPVDEAFTVILEAAKNKFGGMMDAQSKTFEGMLSNFEDWKSATLRKLGEPIFEVLKDKLGSLLAFLGSEGVQSTLNNVATFFSEVLKDAIETVSPAFNDVKEVGLALVNAWNTELMPAIQSIAEQTGIHIPNAKETFHNAFMAVRAVIELVARFLIDYFIPTLVTVVQWVAANWPTIQATIQTVMRAVQAIITTVVGIVTAIWNEWGDEIIAVLNFMVSQYQIIFSAFSKAFEGDWKGFGETLRVAWDNAWKAIGKIVSDAIDKIKNTNWAEVGSNIIQNIANGINSAAHWIVEAALAAAKAAFDAAIGFLTGQASNQNVNVNVVSNGATQFAGAGNRTNNYNLTIYSNAKTEDLQASFGVMKALYSGA